MRNVFGGKKNDCKLIIEEVKIDYRVIISYALSRWLVG